MTTQPFTVPPRSSTVVEWSVRSGNVIAFSVRGERPYLVHAFDDELELRRFERGDDAESLCASEPRRSHRGVLRAAGRTFWLVIDNRHDARPLVVRAEVYL